MECSKWVPHIWMKYAADIGRKAATAKMTEEQVLASIPWATNKFRSFAMAKWSDYVAKLAAIEAVKAANGGRLPKPRSYIRSGVLPVDLVLSNVGQIMQSDCGVPIRCGGWRVRMYAAKGVKCAHCGLEGTMFALERVAHGDASPRSKYLKHHLNLYHKHADGHETMITVDHIIPLSKGGISDLSNLQPLCYPCNQRKGNKLENIKENGVAA